MAVDHVLGWGRHGPEKIRGYTEGRREDVGSRLDLQAARRLAAAVLILAHDQAKGQRFVGRPQDRQRERQEARAFLEGRCGCLAFWCEVAGVGEEKVSKAGREAPRTQDAPGAFLWGHVLKPLVW